MPEIKQYNQTVSPTGPTNLQGATGQDFGSDVGQSVQELGQQVGRLGQVIHQRQAQNDLSKVDANMSEAQDRLGLKMQDALQKGTLDHDAYMKDVNDEMDNLSKSVTTPEGRRRFEQMKASTQFQLSQKAQLGQAQIAGDRAVADVKIANDARSSYVMSNPESFPEILKQQNQAIDDKVALHGLPAARAPELKRELVDNLAKGAVRGVMKQDPELARKQLDDGVWDAYMNDSTKEKLGYEIDRAQRGKIIDQERAEKLKDKAAAATQEAFVVSVLSKMHDPTVPPPTAKDVLAGLQSGKIDSTTAEHLWKGLEADNEQKKLKSDPHVFNDLAHKLSLPDGDPGKITDSNEISKHIGVDVSVQDSNLLMGLLGEKHTPQGEADAAIQKSYFDTTRKQLVKGIPGMEDPEGLKLFQQTQAQALEYSLTAAKNGKTKTQIWAPTIGGKPNPDYVGAHVGLPERSPIDVMNSTIDIYKRGQQPKDTTEMEFPDGTKQFIPNANVEKAKSKFKAKVRAK